MFRIDCRFFVIFRVYVTMVFQFVIVYCWLVWRGLKLAMINIVSSCLVHSTGTYLFHAGELNPLNVYISFSWCSVSLPVVSGLLQLTEFSGIFIPRWGHVNRQNCDLTFLLTSSKHQFLGKLSELAIDIFILFDTAKVCWSILFTIFYSYSSSVFPMICICCVNGARATLFRSSKHPRWIPFEGLWDYSGLCSFMYTASVIFVYHCRDTDLSCIRGIGFQSIPPLEGAGVLNVPEGDSPQNTQPPFIAWFELLVRQTTLLASIMLDFTCGAFQHELRN